jgi:hypothetical protein
MEIDRGERIRARSIKHDEPACWKEESNALELMPCQGELAEQANPRITTEHEVR